MAKKEQAKVAKNKKAAEAEDDDEVEEVTEEEEVTEDDDDAEVEDAEESDDDDEEAEVTEKPAKSKKGGKGNPGNLVPREPVKVSEAVMKGQSKEIRALLKKREELQAAGDKKGLRKLRAELRKKGFRLSNLPGGKLEKKAKPDEETAEEE